MKVTKQGVRGVGTRSRLILAGVWFLSMACAPACADDWQWLGLFPVRDLTPFGLTRLDFVPPHSIGMPEHSLAAELTVSYQNTWARSGNVADYLKARGGRVRLTADDVASIEALPGDAYLVDGEYGLVDLTLQYKASSHFGAYLTVPYLFFDGGYLDSTIEDFHHAVGFGDLERETMARNQWQMIAKLRNTTVTQSSPPKNDFGDPVLGLRYALFDKPERWNLIVETAIKIPRSHAEFMISTGEPDYGMQVSYQRFFMRNALYATAALVYYNAPNPDISRDEWIPTVILGWETRLGQHTGFVLQLYGSRSTVQESNLDELAAHKYQATSGLQWQLGGSILRVGVTENIASFNNTPDVGLSVSYGRGFRR